MVITERAKNIIRSYFAHLLSHFISMYQWNCASMFRVTYHTTQQRNPEDHNINLHHRDDQISHVGSSLFDIISLGPKKTHRKM